MTEPRPGPQAQPAGLDTQPPSGPPLEAGTDDQSRTEAAAAPAVPSTPWTRFAVQAQCDLKLWLVCMGLLSLCRLALFIPFHGRMESGTGAGAVLMAFANGLRFDSQVATVWIAPGLLLGIVAAFAGWGRAPAVLRQVVAGLFVFVTVLLAVITYGYFREYGNQFDDRVFGVVEDDLGAVLATVWKEYPATTVALVMLAFDAALFLGVRRLVRSPWIGGARLARMAVPGRAAATVGLAVFLAAAARGSCGRRPVQEKDAAVTSDPFLNKVVLNAYKALDYTIEVRRRLQRSSKGIRVFLADGDIRGAVRRVVGDERERSGGGDLDACLLRTAPGWASPPRHIFLVVGESYSAWPLEDPYRRLGLAGEVERLGREGILFRNLLPASTGTMTSLATVLTGITEHGAPICYQPNSRRPYPTGLAAIFNRLGYRTRFFYGGYLSWQRIGDFVRDQGFQEVHGGGDVGGRIGGNEWGVPDGALLDFVASRVTDEQPSLNVILTVSNHAPFEVDVRAEGFPLKAMPPELAAVWDGEYRLEQMGHFWYADRCLGRFAGAVSKKLPRTLLAVTGDHYGRHFLNAKPNLAEGSFVPLLLYGPEVLGGARPPAGACGSHTDIAATLTDLAAPAGFTYPAMGRSLLSPEAVGPAFGCGKVVGPGFLAELEGTRSWMRLPAADGAAPTADPDLAALERRQRDLKAIGWWRVLRGPAMPEGPEAGAAKSRDGARSGGGAQRR
ncbi:MAG TPA: LTA synthase family protein [Planctomycetota bacterium]|nr:LTA synthase family protein [Planctomycetota bacterium]